MDDLPFRAEYAKTGRAGCRKCKQKIDQGQLRIAAMIQSYHHDGKDAHWFHSMCFFEKHRPKTAEEIDNFENIRYDDQQNIRKKIEAISGIILPETSKGKGKKRPAENSSNGAALADFGIEYSKSSRAECVGCNNKILKEDIRIKKVVYDTEVGMKFGGQPKWHHLECFVAVRHDYGFYVGGESLPGFASLSAGDKKKVKDTLKAIKVDENMVKKLKSEPKDETDAASENILEEKIKKQNKVIFKIRDKIQALCSKADLQNILFTNNSCMVEGVDGLLDRCSDILTFGALSKCNKCSKGDMIFARYGYKCNGMLDEWTACGNFAEKPIRVKCKIPSTLNGEKDSFFGKYKSKVEDRAVRPVPVDVSKKMNKSMEANEPKVQRKREPLYNMHVVIIGETSTSRDELKRKIEKMGGKLVTKIQEKIAVIISNTEEVEKMNSRIRLAKDFDIQVVPEKFLNEIINCSPTETFEKIKSMSICKWGSDPLTRVPQEEEKHQRESIYEKKGESSKISVKLKNGTAIDPDSGLEDVAHVYKYEGVLYTSVMAKTDIEKNKNSFYKIQVLESDTGKNYWVFRSWGRIGTVIGNTKLEKFDTADMAVEEFERLFEEKTGNMFNSSIPFKKQKEKFYVVDIDYEEDKKIKEINEKSNIPSKLNKKVQEVVQMLFDIESMKKMMLEFELDLDKMPLGRLSSHQLKQAYQVLTELSEHVLKGSSANEFIGLSNKFFTLIPHNFGMKKAPIIDTMEEIQHKIEILDNLIEVEIAYSLLNQDSDEESNPLDYHYNQLKTDLEPLKHDSEQFKMIEKYAKNTHAATHKEYSLEVLDVFAVNRQGEKRRYKPFKKLHNRQLLWHGSRLTNYVGILSHGLKIAPPEAPVTGYMFGKGIYFADMVSKSANYCFTNSNNNVGFMLLSEVALGDVHELTKANSNIQKPPNGKHSVKGLGKTQPNPAQAIQKDGVTIPLGSSVSNEKLKSDLLYNEYIVYDVAQVNIQYLLKMKFNYHKK